ncbi:ABC transporter permease [Pedobacter panaciterrae]|jgi:ABC-type transport system involved in multi-copper enzyme maturation, permease component|uniref:ABC transporter permease n=1 Tax=Pedobacter panaciterrae TaxID=363849 RepID=UPI00155DC425|nr:ABC transporter permease subunit [Pedobacter panaciterrae]NQX52787.1 ABC transporter permease [Pedobacter panaciterrae]
MNSQINIYKTAKGIRKSSPFGVVLHKEMADHIRSWRFIVLIGLIILTFIGSMYVSLGNIRSAISNTNDPDHTFLYLKLLTTTDNSTPPFHVFLSFLGPLLGISLGFDAINIEQNNGTLTRIMAQPLYRDNLLLAKFVSAMIMVGTLFFVLTLLMTGGGLILTGVRMEPQELLRILGFVVISVIYVGFWLSLSIVLSIKFRQAATSALTAIGIWLFFTVFYQIIVNLAIRSILPDPSFLSQDQILRYNEFILDLLRIAPNQLYTDASTTMLMPSVRSLGPMTMEQMAGAIPAPLPFRESLMIVWPQVSGLIGATAACFALSYYLFMRREIRS